MYTAYNAANQRLQANIPSSEYGEQIQQLQTVNFLNELTFIVSFLDTGGGNGRENEFAGGIAQLEVSAGSVGVGEQRFEGFVLKVILLKDFNRLLELNLVFS